MTVLVVMGVSGSGKTTLARALSERLGWDFLEGDDLHPPANVAKMRAGVPLDDADRAPWLAAIASWIGEHVATGRPGIVTCSALRRAYRDELRGTRTATSGATADIRFVQLEAPRDVLAARLADREGHFMPVSLLDSQLATLEPIADSEPGFVVDATRPVSAQVDAVLAAVAELRP